MAVKCLNPKQRVTECGALPCPSAPLSPPLQSQTFQVGRLYTLASFLHPHLATAHLQLWLGGHCPPRPWAWLSDLCLSCCLGCISGGLLHSFLLTSGPWLSSYQLLLSLLRYLFLLKMVLNSGFLSSALIPSPLPSADGGCSHCLSANNPYIHIPQTEQAQAYTLVLPECLSGTSNATRCKPNSPASPRGAALPPGAPAGHVETPSIHGSSLKRAVIPASHLSLISNAHCVQLFTKPG